MESPIAQTESPLEILRRLENLVRVGTIAAVRHGRPARCRVRTGNLTTNWVPWLTARAGGLKRRQWWPPVVGEQCLMLAPGGDLLNAVALPGIYSDANPQASDDPKKCRTDWSESDYMEHDSEFSQLLVSCYGSIIFQVQSSVIEIGADFIRLAAGGGQLIVDKNGATALPDAIANGISLVNHVHGDVRKGSDDSGKPK